MGLLYPFPVSSDETDFVQLELTPQGSVGQVKVKTYGLPYIFWGYALASLTVLFFLWLAIRDTIEKLAGLGGVDRVLAISVELFIYSLPLSVLGFFFFEKILLRKKNQLTVVQKIYGIPVFKKSYELTGQGFSVLHHLDSPNVARLRGGEEALGFQNKGYFTLWAHTTRGDIMIDRHSRKVDLEALVALLNLAR